VEIAGITQYGTDAASDMVTNLKLMAEALHGPRWIGRRESAVGARK
jgi:hypothetical protein